MWNNEAVVKIAKLMLVVFKLVISLMSMLLEVLISNNTGTILKNC